MKTLAYILRLIALSFLFAGSTSIIFAAITLIHSLTAAGMTVSQAAAQNAPIFPMFSTVAMVCAFILLIAESLDYAAHRTLNMMTKARYAASLICIMAALVLQFGIIPHMLTLSIAATNHDTAVAGAADAKAEKAKAEQAKTPEAKTEKTDGTVVSDADAKADDSKNYAVKAEFKKFHSASQIDFSIIIVTALISLLMPAFDPARQRGMTKAREIKVDTVA